MYETLLHADGEQAASYAQAAYVVRGLIDKSAEELDSVHISPLLDVIGARERVGESRVEAERGKFHRQGVALELPVYLEPQVREYLATRAEEKGIEIDQLVNELLKNDRTDQG